MEKADGPKAGDAGRYALLNHVPVGVCVMREDYTVACWNACLGAWTGLKASAVLDRPITDVFPNLTQTDFRRRIDAVLHGGPPVAVPPELCPHLFAIPGAAGDSRFQQANVAAIPGEEDASGHPVYHAMITVEDVSVRELPARSHDVGGGLTIVEADRRKALEADRVRMVERLRHLHHLQSLEILASGIAHDMNNLLSVIVGNSDIIAAEVQGNQLTHHCNNQVQKAAMRASELVAQMLVYSGGGTLVVDVVNLSTLAENMQGLLHSLIPGHIRLEFALLPELPEIGGNSEQLQQIAVNLVANAANAIGDSPGTIRISTGVVRASAGYIASLYQAEALEPGGFVYLEVKDTGAGFDQAALDRIGAGTSGARFTGTGLGLAATQKIVRSHQGGIRVLSIPGERDAFRIHFPLRPAEDAEHLESTRLGGNLDSGPAEGRILLVDDEEMVRALGEIILEQNGYLVVTASDGDEAIRAFEQHADTISLVLLDMSMPKRSGYEVAKAIRGIRADTPIILCSGYSGVDARSRYPDLRVDGFLRKPYRMDALLETVQHMLSERNG